jgi:hypothetical protein
MAVETESLFMFSVEKGSRSRGQNEPPYARLALLNAYNLSLVTASSALAFLFERPSLVFVVIAVEIAWVLFASESTFLKRAWLDPVWEARKKASEHARVAARATSLSLADQNRVRTLYAQRTHIEALARDNPTFGSAMVLRELDKLDELVSEFVTLGAVVAQREIHMLGFDVEGMRKTWTAYAAQHDAATANDPRRDVAAKNLEVLRRRFDRHEALERSIATARGQMDLIESSFRLLADEVLTMQAPTELGERLDELRIAVDAVRVAESDIDAQDFIIETPQQGAERRRS